MMNKITNATRPILCCLLFFFIASLMGLAMRTAYVLEMPSWFNYRNVQHGHSHVALLGWLFGMFYIVIIYVFQLDMKRYIRLFWVLQLIVLVMMFTFPIVGYHSVSILFSILHIFFIYIFAFRIWKDISNSGKQGLAILFLKASIVFLVISTIGSLALGPIVSAGMKGSALYYAAIQFYLHFQFNGWFVFALLALLFQVIHIDPVIKGHKNGKIFFWFLCISTVLTYALAVTWSTPHIAIFLTNSAGVIIQLLALYFGLQLFRTVRKLLPRVFSLFNQRLIYIALSALVLKILIQSAVVLPYLAQMSYTIRNFVIGFIHLLMLGCLSMFLFAIISKMMNMKLSTWGILLFIGGILVTELLLFGQGLMLWFQLGFMPGYYSAIAIGSLLIVVGVLAIFIRSTRFKIV
ncbi:hypothetical protein [Portibacter lacus]|uniref:hypothetical protein n=1 Tax=Portibacter lacus TaxID=1099794 RepID=UPI001F298C67|nr:hypothetical protein [Portibacter lacus]